MSLSPEEARKVALLARLELEDDEIARQTPHLNALLQQFEVLKRLNVEGVEPMSHAFPVSNVLREDVARPSLPREELLACAPEARDGFFIVPRIVES